MSDVFALKPKFKPKKLRHLFLKSFEDLFEPGCLVAVKLHMGEADNPFFLSPYLVAEVVSVVKDLEGRPFLTDSTTLYRRNRFNALDYLNTARQNGFTFSKIGAPIIVADGLLGEHGVRVDVDGLIREVEVAQAVYEADTMIVLTHCTGHISLDYGGAIKNVGMGCVTKNGKRMVHCHSAPLVDKNKCTGCGTCATVCPFDVIHVRKHAVLNIEWCVGCGRCIMKCPNNALYQKNEWKQRYVESLVNATGGILKNFFGGVGFINFLSNVTEGCDCGPETKVIVEDAGALASRDMVSLEQASLDLIRGKKKDFGSDGGDLQIKYAVRKKLGSRKYNLVEV